MQTGEPRPPGLGSPVFHIIMGRSKPLVMLLLAILVGLWLLSASVVPTPANPTPIPITLDEYPWAYLRNGRPLISDEDVVSIIAVGDVMLGRDVGRENGSSGVDPWMNVNSWLSTSDLTLGNLESILLEEPIPETTTSSMEPIFLSASATTVNQLQHAGFDILGVANNHSLDFGVIGLSESVSHLERAGLDIIGLESTDNQSYTIIKNVNGLRLAFLAFNAVPGQGTTEPCSGVEQCSPLPARWNPVTSVAAISSALRQADAVIVSVHWGFEYEPIPDPYQKKIAQLMLSAGADLVLGHHPHVAQTMSVVGDGLVAYSLGNFVFDQGQGDTHNGLALQAFFDKDGLRGVQVLPVRAGLRPRLQDTTEAAELLDRVLPSPPRLGFSCDGETCTSISLPSTNDMGEFYADRIDLTGDGLPEIVRRVGQQVVIYEEGNAAWRSPETWQIDDITLGDPNNDGRYEIMLALRRQDEAGIKRSQPYIIGHRGGRYNLLWGGRPVTDPIQELVVGDVDGDGQQELVVIEALADGTGQAVSIWRWAGWTFSLVWRSEPGRYCDLVLLAGERPLLSVTQPLP